MFESPWLSSCLLPPLVCCALDISRPDTGPGEAQLNQALSVQWGRTPGTWLTSLVRAKASMTFGCQSFGSRFIFINTRVTQSRAGWCEVTRSCTSIGLCSLSQSMADKVMQVSVFPSEGSRAAVSCVSFFLLTYTANYLRSAEVWYLIRFQQFIWNFKPLEI